MAIFTQSNQISFDSLLGSIAMQVTTVSETGRRQEDGNLLHRESSTKKSDSYKTFCQKGVFIMEVCFRDLTLLSAFLTTIVHKK